MTMTGYKGPQDRFGVMEAVKGESFDGEVLLYQSDGVTPINLMGLEFEFYLWNDISAPPVVTCNAANLMITKVDADGSVGINIPTATMDGLDTVAHLFQLWADNGFGVRKMILWGYFWVKGGMTP